MNRNLVILLGRVGQDVKTEYTKAGLAIARISLATSEWKKDQPQKTQWHNIVCFGKAAEFCHKNVKRGDSLFVEGKIEYSDWQDKQGVKRKNISIVANTVNKIYEPKQEEQTKPQPQLPSLEEEGWSSGEEDIPF